MELLEHISLAEQTALQIGGPARFFVTAKTVEEVRQGLQMAATRSLPWAVLGAGTSTLIADQGFDGVLIKLAGAERDTLPLGSLIFAGETIGGVGSVGAQALHGLASENLFHQYHWMDASGSVQVIDAAQWQTSALRHGPGILVGVVPNRDIHPQPEAAHPSLPSARAFLDRDGNAAGTIAEVGWAGRRLGHAWLWEQDATWVCVESGAKADEVVQLMSLVKQQVRDTLGVQLRDGLSYVGI